MLADKSFLLIDTILFSMSYTGKRNNDDYLRIVANSLDWWTNKLNSDKINFTENVKIAFAFKVNGLAAIRALKGVLKLKGGQQIILKEDMIAADGSGYTNSDKLRAIYNIKFGH